MSREDVFSAYPERIAIGPGVTADFPAIPGQNAIQIKWASGGSLLVAGTSSTIGSTFAISNEYLVSTSEILSIDLSGTISLMASGATAVAYILRYRSAGF